MVTQAQECSQILAKLGRCASALGDWKKGLLENDLRHLLAYLWADRALSADDITLYRDVFEPNLRAGSAQYLIENGIETIRGFTGKDLDLLLVPLVINDLLKVGQIDLVSDSTKDVARFAFLFAAREGKLTASERTKVEHVEDLLHREIESGATAITPHRSQVRPSNEFAATPQKNSSIELAATNAKPIVSSAPAQVQAEPVTFDVVMSDLMSLACGRSSKK